MNANLIQKLLKASENKAIVDIELNSGEIITGSITFSKKQIEINGSLYDISGISEVKEHINPIERKLEEFLSELIYIRLKSGEIKNGFLLNIENNNIELITIDEQLIINILEIEEVSNKEIRETDSVTINEDKSANYEDVNSNGKAIYPYGGFELKLYIQQSIPEDVKKVCLKKFENHEYRESLNVLSECKVNDDNREILEELLDYLKGVVERFEAKEKAYGEPLGYCYQGSLAGTVEYNIAKALSYYKLELVEWGPYSALALCSALHIARRFGTVELMYETALELEKNVDLIEDITGKHNSQTVAYKSLLSIYSMAEDWERFNCCLRKWTDKLTANECYTTANNAWYKYSAILIENGKYDYAQVYCVEMLEKGEEERALLLLMHYAHTRYGELEMEERILQLLQNDAIKAKWQSIKDNFYDQYKLAVSKMEYLESAYKQLVSMKKEKEKQEEGNRNLAILKSDRILTDEMVKSVQSNELKLLFAEAQRERSHNGNLKKAETLYRQLIEKNYSINTVVADLISIMVQVKDYKLAAMYLGRIGSHYMVQKTYGNVKKALISCAPACEELVAKYEKEEVDEDLLKGIPLSKKTENKGDELKDAVKESNHRYYYKKIKGKGNDRDIEQFLLNVIGEGNDIAWTTKQLLDFYLKKGLYTKAMEYLFEYGCIYFSVVQYDKYYNKIIPEIPSGVLLDYFDETKRNINVIALAQKAERIDKDVNKAIDYYVKAINEDNFVSTGVSNLARLYNSLEMYGETIKLLQDKKVVKQLDVEFVSELIIMTVVKAQNLEWKNILIGAYEKILNQQKNVYGKNEIVLKKANSLYELKDYAASAKCYKQFLKNSKWYMTISPKGLHTYKNTMIKLCDIYIQQGNQTEAKKVALDILEIDANDEYAKNVISGTVVLESEIIEEHNDKENISALIYQIVNKVSLETELKQKKYVKNGVFMGSVDEASNIIKALSYQTYVSDEAQSNTYFALAKMVGQIVSRKVNVKEKEATNVKEKEVINEQLYSYYLAKGILAYGNSQLYREEYVDNFEVARYFYLQVVRMTNGDYFNSKLNRASITNSIHKYILTFFENRDIIKRIKDAEAMNDELEANKMKEIEKTFSLPLAVTPAVLFGGIVNLIKNRDYRVNNISRIVFESDNLNYIIDPIIDLCGMNYSTEDVDQLQYDDFFNMWNKARGRYINLKQSFTKKLNMCLNNAFSVGEIQSLLERIREDEYLTFLDETDKLYVEEYIACFERLRRYNEISEFDLKIENLVSAEDIRDRLENLITKFPTAFSYDDLLPMVHQLKQIIFKESTEIFGSTKPEINIVLHGESSIDTDKLVVKVPIAFINKNNVQNADNVIISINTPDQVFIENELQLRGILIGNGNAYAEMVTFRISKQIVEDKVFSIDIGVKYRYRENMQKVCDGEVQKSLTIPLYSNEVFEKIENKFEPHRNGSEVRDESMFYGRTEDIDNIINKISDSNGNVLKGRCLALYGQTRTGKSSILYHLEKKLRKIDKIGNIIINIGSIGEESLTGSDITEFLYTVLDTLLQELTMNHSDLYKAMVEEGIEIMPDTLLENPERGQLIFNSQFRKFMHYIEGQNDVYNVIMMVDEFTYVYDWIRKGIMTDNFMKFWKAFIQNNGIFAIIIGQDHMMKFVNEEEFSNDFGSTDLKKVNYLKEEDAKRLMDEPIRFVDNNGKLVSRYKEGALDRLYELTCGSAFLIMNICAGLVDYLNEIRSVYITKAHINEYLHRNLSSFEESRYFEPQYADKSELGESDIVEENKTLLRKIAKYSEKKEWALIKHVVTNDREKELLNNLSDRDVIIIENNERCKIKVALYKEWIIEKYGVEV